MTDQDKSSNFSKFEDTYIKLRKIEGRLLTIDQIKKLPESNSTFEHHSEWNLRKRSTWRLIKYIEKRNFETGLDLGCGNGWFSFKIAPLFKSLIALDVNKTELSVANQVLSSFPHVKIEYGDIMDFSINEKLDIIILNASIQYFGDLEQLLKRLMNLLSEKGEIHILDSPFYKSKEDSFAARKRSIDYYAKMNAHSMASFYHHHRFDLLGKFKPTILYNPNSLVNRMIRKFGYIDSPFPWTKVTKSTVDE